MTYNNFESVDHENEFDNFEGGDYEDGSEEDDFDEEGGFGDFEDEIDNDDDDDEGDYEEEEDEEGEDMDEFETEDDEEQYSESDSNDDNDAEVETAEDDDDDSEDFTVEDQEDKAFGKSEAFQDEHVTDFANSNHTSTDSETEGLMGTSHESNNTNSRKAIIIGFCCCILILAGVAVALFFTVFNKDDENPSGSKPIVVPTSAPNGSNGTSDSTKVPTPASLVTGSPTQSATEVSSPSPTQSPAPTEPLPSVIPIDANADTSLRDGDFSGQIDGKKDSLLAQEGLFSSRIVLSFDLASLPSYKNFTNAFLQLEHVPSIGGSETNLTVFRIPSTVLVIETLSWDIFQPDDGLAGPTFTVSPGDSLVEIDVSDLIVAQRRRLFLRRTQESSQLLLMIKAGASSGNETGVEFRSREFQDGAFAPRIQFQYTTQIPTNVPNASSTISPAPSSSLGPTEMPSSSLAPSASLIPTVVTPYPTPFCIMRDGNGTSISAGNSTTPPFENATEAIERVPYCLEDGPPGDFQGSNETTTPGEFPGSNVTGPPDDIPARNETGLPDEVPGKNVTGPPDGIPVGNQTGLPDEVPGKNVTGPPDGMSGKNETGPFEKKPVGNETGPSDGFKQPGSNETAP